MFEILVSPAELRCTALYASCDKIMLRVKCLATLHYAALVQVSHIKENVAYSQNTRPPATKTYQPPFITHPTSSQDVGRTLLSDVTNKMATACVCRVADSWTRTTFIRLKPEVSTTCASWNVCKWKSAQKTCSVSVLLSSFHFKCDDFLFVDDSIGTGWRNFLPTCLRTCQNCTDCKFERLLIR